MHHMSKVYIIIHRESNADETLAVNTEEKYQYQWGRGIPLQIASEFMQYIPVRRW